MMLGEDHVDGCVWRALSSCQAAGSRIVSVIIVMQALEGLQLCVLSKGLRKRL
jgi:hypothetical protein